MAVIPVGSLVFTGFGDGTDGKPSFLTNAGADAGVPTTDPAPGAPNGNWFGVAQDPISGNYCCVGCDTDSPDFFVTLFFDSEWNFLAGSTNNSQSVAVDGSGNFYTIASGTIRKYTSAGSLTTSFTVTGSSMRAIGVNQAGTIAYYGKQTSDNIIHRWDLSGNTAMADFVTGPTANGPCLNAGILVLQDDTVVVGWRGSGGTGFIRRYDTAGATLDTYNIANEDTPVFYQLAPTDSAGSFLVSTYGTPDTNTIVSRVTSSGGAIISDFEVDNQTFFYDGPFCALQVAVTDAVSPDPLPNGTCADAVVLTELGQTAVNTLNASQDPDESDSGCGSGDSWNAAWYKYTATADFPIGIESLGGDVPGDSIITVFSGACGSLVNLGCVANGSAQLELDFEDGTDYFFMLTSLDAGGHSNQILDLEDLTPPEPVGQFCTELTCESVPGAGIYVMVPDKRFDTLYLNVMADPPTTEDIKIPDPTVDLAFFGDE